MAKLKSSSATSPKGCWLYPISERGDRFFVLDGGKKYPVSVDTYKMLVEDGRLGQDERWGLHINFHNVQPGDEVFIYSGDQNVGIIGFAKVKEVDVEDRLLTLRFDINKCKALLTKPVPAEIVRNWIANPRAAVCNLSQFKTDLSKRLPWKQPHSKDHDILRIDPLTKSAGFGLPKMNKKVEKAAIKRVKEMYVAKGWSVTSVEQKKLGFDLLCKKSSDVRKVEVKGVKGQTVGFLMTAGEYSKASTDSRFVLHVVLEALSKKPIVKTWTGKQMLKALRFVAIQYQAALRV